MKILTTYDKGVKCPNNYATEVKETLSRMVDEYASRQKPVGHIDYWKLEIGAVIEKIGKKHPRCKPIRVAFGEYPEGCYSAHFYACTGVEPSPFFILRYTLIEAYYKPSIQSFSSLNKLSQVLLDSLKLHLRDAHTIEPYYINPQEVLTYLQLDYAQLKPLHPRTGALKIRLHDHQILVSASGREAFHITLKQLWGLNHGK